MNIELTALEAGTLVFFSIAILGMVMALRLRTIRKKKKVIKQEKAWKAEKAKTTEEFEFKVNPETLAPQKVLKEKPSQEQPKNEPIDTDALLKDLKDESEAK